MSRRYIIAVIIGSALLVGLAGFFATRELIEADLAVQKLKTVRQEHAQWQRTIAELEAAHQRATNSTYDKFGQSAATNPARPEETSKAAPVDDLAAMHLQSLEAEAQLNLDRFFRAQRLSSKQGSAIAHRVALLNASTLEFSSKAPPEAHGNPSHPESMAFKADWDKRQARFQTDMAELLGPDGYEAYQHFQRTLPHWRHVTSLATQLFRTDAPLQPGQATQLAQIIINNATNAQGVITSSPANWEIVFSEAAGILSPPQFEMFTTLKARGDLRQQLNRMIIRTKSGRRE